MGCRAEPRAGSAPLFGATFEAVPLRPPAVPLLPFHRSSQLSCPRNTLKSLPFGGTHCPLCPLPQLCFCLWICLRIWLCHQLPCSSRAATERLCTCVLACKILLEVQSRIRKSKGATPGTQHYPDLRKETQGREWPCVSSLAQGHGPEGFGLPATHAGVSWLPRAPAEQPGPSWRSLGLTPAPAQNLLSNVEIQFRCLSSFLV